MPSVIFFSNFICKRPNIVVITMLMRISRMPIHANFLAYLNILNRYSNEKMADNSVVIATSEINLNIAETPRRVWRDQRFRSRCRS